MWPLRAGHERKHETGDATVERDRPEMRPAEPCGKKRLTAEAHTDLLENVMATRGFRLQVDVSAALP